MKTWAAIFDWDGVIVDSSAQHEASWQVLAKKEGRTLPPGHFKKGFGMKNEVIIPNVLGWAKDPAEIDRLARAKEQVYRDLVDRDGIEPIPGVMEWLATLKAARIPCAIGSSTHRLNIDCVLRHIHLADYFAAIVAGNDVTHGKPAPDIFLKAAERLGYQPARCVVFEDAHVGIEAARAGGMKVVAVTTTHPAESLGDADLVVERLDQLEIAGGASSRLPEDGATWKLPLRVAITSP